MTSDTPPPTVWPTLRARDARALIRFYVEVFGFEETAVFGDGEHVSHAELSWPEGGGIMLGSADGRGADDRWALAPGSSGAYVVTDDVAGVHARAVAAGAEMIRKLEEMDYGGQEFSVADPEGNRWSFGNYRGEPRKA